ncbi:MAG: hypothetical protein PF570_06015 [Candidatus Cloacimonetes bacterium]|jgi:hypothetical protein|nr:hypothetical protein [Candidatus Cloacimonadota bacterium]
MNHSGSLIINVEGKGKSYFLWNGNESYYKKLRLAYKDIQDDKISDYSYFSFFILCASTLEYSLNYIIADYCLNTFGHEKCKPFIDGYTALNFKKKILMTPSIISNGELIFNEDKMAFKKLNELVSLRNRIMHGKEELNEFDFPDIKEVDEKEIQLELATKPNPIDNLNKDKCLEFGNALGDFKKFIMEPWFINELKENDLLVKNKN